MQERTSATGSIEIMRYRGKSSCLCILRDVHLFLYPSYFIQIYMNFLFCHIRIIRTKFFFFHLTLCQTLCHKHSHMSCQLIQNRLIEAKDFLKVIQLMDMKVRIQIQVNLTPKPILFAFYFHKGLPEVPQRDHMVISLHTFLSGMNKSFITLIKTPIHNFKPTSAINRIFPTTSALPKN